MLKRRGLLLAALTCGVCLVTGCISLTNAPRATPEFEAMSKQFDTPKDTASLYIYSNYGARNILTVTVNENEYVVDRQAYLFSNVEKGEYDISYITTAKHGLFYKSPFPPLTLKISENRPYFVYIEVGDRKDMDTSEVLKRLFIPGYTVATVSMGALEDQYPFNVTKIYEVDAKTAKPVLLQRNCIDMSKLPIMKPKSIK